MRAGGRCSTRRWRRRRKPPSVPGWNWPAPPPCSAAQTPACAAPPRRPCRPAPRPTPAGCSMNAPRRSTTPTPTPPRRLLNDRAALEDDAQVQAALQAALRAIDGRLAWGERLGALFSGISLGSILLLVALGLAITYELMGVNNMDHGELML